MAHPVTEIEAAVAALAALDEPQRVHAYNRIVAAAAAMLGEAGDDPALSPQLLPTAAVRANDYNPNKVAAPELDLLEESMRADGITMCVVVVRDGDGATVVDGFHRRTVAADRLARRFIPCAVIETPLGDRMASTVRHNRARGKHDIELMGSLVRGMEREGKGGDEIRAALGMSEEELLRLRQTVGAAAMLAPTEYEQSWETEDGDDDPARRQNPADAPAAKRKRRG